MLKLSLSLLILVPMAAVSQPQVLESTAERTGWQQTGRYEEVESMCVALAKQYPLNFRCDQFGQTPEGRPMLAFVMGAPGQLKPSPARPVVLFQGGIHAGEIDGKDAGLVLVKDILEARRLPGLLSKLTLVFVPVFNVDGHERFGANNRPNQVGPEKTGWRTTAQNFNLNRDYLKVDAPEMEAMLSLLNAWDPVVYVDLHVTDGAQFQHDIAVMIEANEAGPPALQEAGRELRGELMLDLKAAGHLPLWFYPSFNQEDEPLSGISTKPQSARFSNGYWALRNRLGVLVETHSWRNYRHRCQATMTAMQSILAKTAKSGRKWREAMDKADHEMSQLAGKPTILSYKNTEKAELIDFLGYEYKRKPSEVSGQLMTVYDPTHPEIWKIPLQKEFIPDVKLKAPIAGYIIPPAYRKFIEPKLRAHKINFTQLDSEQSLQAEVYRVQTVKLAAGSYEKHQRADYKGEWVSLQETIARNSLFLPIDQPGAVLLMQLFEPESTDSLLAWGYFNEIFERKEYMEPYVAEALALELLKVPALRQEFESKLAHDQEFAKNPQARLDFFYRQHTSFDQRYFRYPVLRLAQAPLKPSS